jgi:CDP-paratose 2-epimerase
MDILITGACGFVGSTLARAWVEGGLDHTLHGMDNLLRAGSEINRATLMKLGINLVHGDLRAFSDFECLPKVDWVIDAAANPSVMAGIDGKTSSRQIVEHNLSGTINMLEFCKRCGAGLIILSTSRVYSIASVERIPLEIVDRAFRPVPTEECLPGFSTSGISEDFCTLPPLSLYGATKLASEVLALEYGQAFNFPIWINRCGVLAGAGQFGHAEQGIFSFWIHSWLQRRPLRFIGFGGRGYQVRDCLHPKDLLPALKRQMEFSGEAQYRIFNFGGGTAHSMSLAQLSSWCEQRLGSHSVEAELGHRAFDVPWMVLDCERAKAFWDWQATTPLESVLEEIATFAENHPKWLELSLRV